MELTRESVEAELRRSAKLAGYSPEATEKYVRYMMVGAGWIKEDEPLSPKPASDALLPGDDPRPDADS